ncbi:hypothetical protein HDG34_003126 [Paraburkholderia sp. HC6.4b]|uniref:hypothetical protein n=1 Tax=unclassified Paraburkholderia TaxID=2615204 RepID=UPI00161BBC63|nr:MULTISPECIES: hypothetical protein [unclassified Paraburkholderia]MBB5409185.1 hypothetical protein [Paraburkholderia sp. HC6.4b]MBB5450913.1 hypothetical protein [Paraburkholderia sp. Kb1A]
MSRFSQPLTHLIHENLSVIVTFAFSWHPLLLLRGSRFHGEWKYFDRALFKVSEQCAERACLELATFIRLLDDDEKIAEHLRQSDSDSFGQVVKKDRPNEPLYLRDLTNKIIHAQHLKWDFSVPDDPKLVCISRDPERWLRAEIQVVALVAFCGQLIA